MSQSQLVMVLVGNNVLCLTRHIGPLSCPQAEEEPASATSSSQHQKAGFLTSDRKTLPSPINSDERKPRRI